jgi:hypothetical protein
MTGAAGTSDMSGYIHMMSLAPSYSPLNMLHSTRQSSQSHLHIPVHECIVQLILESVNIISDLLLAKLQKRMLIPTAIKYAYILGIF